MSTTEPKYRGIPLKDMTREELIDALLDLQKTEKVVMRTDPLLPWVLIGCSVLIGGVFLIERLWP